MVGRTLFHDHLYVCLPGAELDRRYPFDRDRFLANAAKRMRDLRRLGVTTFVDPLPIDLGRDVELIADIAEVSGMTIVCATGFYYEREGIPLYWRSRDAQELADFFIAEIEDGIGPRKIRPGVIKCATGGAQPTSLERKVIHAACLAHLATGAPIITHTQGGVGGPEQQALFGEFGVDLSRCVIGHCCENPDPDYHRLLAGGGSFIGFDRIGIARYQSDDVRADTIATLVAEGLGGFLLLSQDFYCAMRGKVNFSATAEEQAEIDRKRERDEWPRHQTYLFTEFLPLLRQRGVSDAEIERMLVRNPARFLAGLGPEGAFHPEGRGGAHPAPFERRDRG